MLIIGGCTGIGAEDPYELLSQAYRNYGQDDFTFDVSTSGEIRTHTPGSRRMVFYGYVSGHNEIYLEPGDSGRRLQRGIQQDEGWTLHYKKENRNGS